jgi:hypothetical protein
MTADGEITRATEPKATAGPKFYSWSEYTQVQIQGITFEAS